MFLVFVKLLNGPMNRLSAFSQSKQATQRYCHTGLNQKTINSSGQNAYANSVTFSVCHQAHEQKKERQKGEEESNVIFTAN